MMSQGSNTIVIAWLLATNQHTHYLLYFKLARAIRQAKYPHLGALFPRRAKQSSNDPPLNCCHASRDPLFQYIYKISML